MGLTYFLLKTLRHLIGLCFDTDLCCFGTSIEMVILIYPQKQNQKQKVRQDQSEIEARKNSIFRTSKNKAENKLTLSEGKMDLVCLNPSTN